MNLQLQRGVKGAAGRKLRQAVETQPCHPDPGNKKSRQRQLSWMIVVGILKGTELGARSWRGGAPDDPVGSEGGPAAREGWRTGLGLVIPGLDCQPKESESNPAGTGKRLEESSLRGIKSWICGLEHCRCSVSLREEIYTGAEDQSGGPPTGKRR